MLMRGVVIGDHMNSQLLGGFPMDLFQETEPLDMRVTALGTRDQFTVQIVERGE